MSLRKILFRGKPQGGREWVEGYYSLKAHLPGTIEEEIYPTIEVFHGSFFRVDPITVGQYIGLQDKNGVRLFEGDILSLDGEDGYFLLNYDDDAARFVMDGDGLTVDFDNFYPYEVEVVGNIHDNPELLEVGTE